MSTEDLDIAEQREELLLSIERDENEVRAAVQQLTDAAGAKLDARAYIRNLPLTWVLGAFLVGVWLGSRRSSGMAEVVRGREDL